jgi:hypothetical protein
MAKYYSARKAGVILGLPHLEVIRRIRKGDIRAQKLDWNWIVTEDAIEEARQSDWYQRRLARQATDQPATT